MMKQAFFFVISTITSPYGASGHYGYATFIAQNKYAENAPAVLNPNDTLLTQEFNVALYKDN